MVCLQSKIDLSKHNTLNLPCIAEQLIECNDETELLGAFQSFPLNIHNIFVLGGGSNVILPPRLDQYVLTFKKKAPRDALLIIEENQDYVLVDMEAGVDWDAFVAYSLEQGYYGLENLSLIPGTVGAAPIQNIGAYGVEVADFIQQVRVFNVAKQAIEILSAEQCQFAYRDSIFKRSSGHYIIISVRFRLAKTANFILEYGELSALKASAQLTGTLVREKVIETRKAKLPDPKSLPNTGSFFKNPVVSAQRLAELKQNFPQIVSYALTGGGYKLAAAWLIDQAGWKGYREAHVGVHDKQALVIVNHNGAQQNEIMALAKSIQDSIYKKFKVQLEIEPVVISS